MVFSSALLLAFLASLGALGVNLCASVRSAPLRYPWYYKMRLSVLNKRNLVRFLRFAALALLALAAVGGIAIFWLSRGLPDPKEALHSLPPASVRVTDRHGNLLYTSLAQGSALRVPIPPEQIPACMKQATVAVEDATFYQNPGVDWKGILRALWLDLRARRVVAGGSTITQQVARNLLLTPAERNRRTLRRKIREMLLARRLTRSLTKEQILALYLNHTYYGGFAYGVEAAAQTYFGKPAAQLTLPECALLAGLPQAPNLYNPFKHPRAARARQKVVLSLMVKHGFITKAEAEQALAVPLQYNPAPYPMRAPHAVWMALEKVAELQAKGVLPKNAPLEVRTTLDLGLQTSAEEAVRRHLKRLQKYSVTDAAVVILDPHTGDVLALVGSADYNNRTIQGAVNMATMPRSTGSAFKPIIYAAALQPTLPHPFTEATVFWDVRTVFHTADGKPYIPHDYDLREHGPVSLKQALASSLNIPAVETLQFVGVGATLAYARRLGIRSLKSAEQYDLSLALGGGEVSILELADASTAFADAGRFHPYRLLLDVRDADGHVLYHQAPPRPTQVWDERVAWLISDILSDDAARTIGFPPHSSLEVGFPAAVKTGTSSGFHDNWAVGYTPDFVVGVWAGNANFEPMQGVDGLTGAAPIWHSVIRAAARLRPSEGFKRPEGLVSVRVCSLSGLLPTPNCPITHRAWFIRGTEPTEPDNVYHRVEIDVATGRLATDSTPPERRKTVLAVVVPPRAQSWARKHGFVLLNDLLARSSPLPRTEQPLVMLSPADNAVYRLSPDAPAGSQAIVVEAASALGTPLAVTLWVDGRPWKRITSPPYRAWWNLEVGTHRFWAQAVDADGRVLRSRAVQIRVEGGTP